MLEFRFHVLFIWLKSESFLAQFSLLVESHVVLCCRSSQNWSVIIARSLMELRALCYIVMLLHFGGIILMNCLGFLIFVFIQLSERGLVVHGLVMAHCHLDR